MLLKNMPFVEQFIKELNDSIGREVPEFRLTLIQQYWLSFCLSGILVTNSVCWARFERASLGNYTVSALSWMFCKSVIAWESLFLFSVKLVLSSYGITQGTLVIDDSDKKRSKNTTRIFFNYKVYDKSTDGYFNGQTIVFLLLITPEVTVPVGFAFYRPDPQLALWRKEDTRLKQLGIPKRKRPPLPIENLDYPSKEQIARNLLLQFQEQHPSLKIQMVLADAFYGTAEFVNYANDLFQTQVISQVRSNQLVRFRNQMWSVENYFETFPGVKTEVKIRGGESINALMNGARLYLKAHDKKRFIIALKYEGEKEYRYLMACDLSWRSIDVVQGYSLRWLVEVFIEDWKSYEGWGQLTKQTGEEGASRSLILSLMLDHCLLLHPFQVERVKSKQPAVTVGSLRERILVENWMDVLREIISAERPEEVLKGLEQAISGWIPLADSSKHMSGRALGRLEPTESLKYWARRASA